MGKKKTIKDGIFDGMTGDEAEAFLVETLSNRPEIFECIAQHWRADADLDAGRE